MKFEVTLRGICPMLQHRFSEDALTGVKSAGSGIKNPNEAQKRTIAESYLYKNSKNKLCVPANMIEGSIISASGEFKLAGAGKKTYKEMAKSSMFVFPEMIELKDQNYTVDVQSVVTPATGGRKMCYRPRFNEWEISFVLEVTDPRADVDTLKMILETAGLRKGIGSYRPKFGRFEVIKFDEVTKSKK